MKSFFLLFVLFVILATACADVITGEETAFLEEVGNHDEVNRIVDDTIVEEARVMEVEDKIEEYSLEEEHRVEEQGEEEQEVESTVRTQGWRNSLCYWLIQ